MAREVEISIGGTVYRLPKLTVAEYLELADRARVQHRERVLANLEAAGVDADTRLKELKEADEQAGSGLAAFRYLVSPAGAIEAIRTSIRHMNGGTPDINAIDPLQAVHLACDLCGVDLSEPGDDDEQEEE